MGINDSRACSIHKKLGEMIAIDSQPISIVEDPGFINFVKSLEPRYKIQNRKYFTEKVFPKMIIGVKAELDKILLTPDVKHYSFTTDIWSTIVAHRCLLSLTAHWISDSFEKSSAVLHVTLLQESHTGNYICVKFSQILLTWGINMVKVMRDANLCSYGCFAHSLQLVVNDGYCLNG